MSQPSGQEEIELQNIVIVPADIPYVPDELWLKIFYYIDDPRQLVKNVRICKRFQTLLTKTDLIWENSLGLLQVEFQGIVKRGLFNPRFVIVPRNAPNYQKVVGYGQSIYGYWEDVEKNKPKPKTKLQKVLGPSPIVGNLLILSLLALFYCFFTLLALTLDKKISVPPFGFFLLAIFFSFILIGIIVALIVSYRPFDFMKQILVCNMLTLIAVSSFAVNFMLIVVLTFVHIQTGRASTALWVFLGFGFGIIMFLVFTFECHSTGLSYRYGLAFRLFAAVAFTCFCLGIVMLVYTQYNSQSSNSFQWAFAAWVFSFLIMLFYLFFLALCFGNGYSSPRGFNFFWYGITEGMTCALFLSTAILCYINIVRSDDDDETIPWLKSFVPIFLFPFFIFILCCNYSKKRY